jgi:hypothetical protein
MEIWNPEGGGSWHLDTRHDPDLGLDRPGLAAGGGFFGAAGGTYKQELWTAGGFNGKQEANGQVGGAQMYIYREKEGMARKRKDKEGVRTLAPGGGIFHAAGGVIDGVFYCAGGVSNNVAGTLFDGKNGRVTSTADLTAVTLTPKVRDDLQRVDIVGFEDADRGKPLPTGVAGAASVVYKGHLYLIGGYKFDAAGAVQPINLVQDYDPKGDKWIVSGQDGATVPALPEAIHSAAAAATAHTLYVAGGVGPDGKVRDSFYVFDFNSPPDQRKWREAPSLPTARSMLVLVPFSDALWAIGGYGADGAALRTVEKFYTEIPALLFVCSRSCFCCRAAWPRFPWCRGPRGRRQRPRPTLQSRRWRNRRCRWSTPPTR